MACSSLISYTGFLKTQRNIRIRFPQNLSYSSSISLPLLGSCIYCKSPQIKLISSQIKSLVDEKRNRETRLGKPEFSDLRKKFSLRLRPRLRLLSIKLKRVSIKSVINGIKTYLQKNMKRVSLSASISIIMGLCFLFLKLTAMPSPKIVPYSDMVSSLEKGSVLKVLFEEGSRRIYYNTNSWSSTSTESSQDNEKNVKRLTNVRSLPQWEYSTRKIDHDERYLLNLMRERGTSYSSAPQSLLMSLRSMLVTVITLWIPLSPLMWLAYRQVSAANTTSKKRRPSNQLVSFEDVEGVDSAKVELLEIVLCLRGAINYNKLGAKLPRGVLLVGPPGTGKTLLARAVAGEAGVPFFSVSASEFVEMFVGRGAARIRDLFSVARKNAPSIIFIDELDAVGGKRGRSLNDERDQTLNQLLTEMDGFESDMNVVVIAATNRPEALDPALCRPGRFSRKVFVGEPDESGRRKILAVHLRSIPLEEESDIICNLVAALTQGLVGADLANIVNEAALLAARRGGECVTREDMMEAIERAKYGINERRVSGKNISKRIEKLFPWIVPSLVGKNDTRKDDTFPGPTGYQTLS